MQQLLQHSGYGCGQAELLSAFHRLESKMHAYGTLSQHALWTAV